MLYFGVPIIDPNEQSKLDADVYKVDKSDITGNKENTLNNLKNRYGSCNLSVVDMYSFSSFIRVKT